MRLVTFLSRPCASNNRKGIPDRRPIPSVAAGMLWRYAETSDGMSHVAC